MDDASDTTGYLTVNAGFRGYFFLLFLSFFDFLDFFAMADHLPRVSE